MAKEKHFVLTFPVWAASYRTGNVDCILRAEHAENKIGTPIFTEEKKAQWFLKSTPDDADPLMIRLIASPIMLLGILTFASNGGITDVIFNPANQDKEETFITSIQKVCDYLVKKIETDNSLWS